MPGCSTAFLMLGQNANTLVCVGGGIGCELVWRQQGPGKFLRPFVLERVKFWPWMGQNTGPGGGGSGWVAGRLGPEVPGWDPHRLVKSLVGAGFCLPEGPMIMAWKTKRAYPLLWIFVCLVVSRWFLQMPKKRPKHSLAIQHDWAQSKICNYIFLFSNKKKT